MTSLDKLGLFTVIALLAAACGGASETSKGHSESSLIGDGDDAGDGGHTDGGHTDGGPAPS